MEYIEIVNWKKAQPRMKGGGQEWLKLYTSLLEHEGFAGMSDTSRVLIVALWLYAARTGHHILPADPEWLWRRIPILSARPDLQPLIDAVDMYGNPTPFVKYCKPPRKRAAGKSAAKKSAAKKEQSREEKNRVEKREEKREENRILTDTKEKRKRKNKRIASDCTNSKKEQKGQTGQKEQTESEKSANPMESEAGPASGRQVMPRPARSVNRSRVRRISDIVPAYKFDADAIAFGEDIFDALGLAHKSHLYHSQETGAFASWWVACKRSAAVAFIDDLRQVAIKKACYVRLKAKSARNKSAVWFSIMAGELASRGVKLPAVRAGP